MSYYDYEESKEIDVQGFGFYALLMAAMRRADSDNMNRLRIAFPDVHAELIARYNAPGGLLPGESIHTETEDTDEC